MGLYYADPAQRLTAVGEELDYLDHGLCDLSARRAELRRPNDPYVSFQNGTRATHYASKREIDTTLRKRSEWRTSQSGRISKRMQKENQTTFFFFYCPHIVLRPIVF